MVVVFTFGQENDSFVGGGGHGVLVGHDTNESDGSGQVQLSSVITQRGQVTLGHGPQRANNGSDSVKNGLRVYNSRSDGSLDLMIVTVEHFFSEK